MSVRPLTEEEGKRVWKYLLSQIQPYSEEQLKAMHDFAFMTAAERRAWEKENKKWLHYSIFPPK